MSGRPSAEASISTVTPPGRRCSSPAPAAEQAVDDLDLAHADRRRQRRGAGVARRAADRRRARAAGRRWRDGRRRRRAAARCSPGRRRRRPAKPRSSRRRTASASPTIAAAGRSAACSARLGNGQPRQSSQSARSRRPTDSATPSGVWPSAARASPARRHARPAASARASRPSAAARCRARHAMAVARFAVHARARAGARPARIQPSRTASASGGSPAGEAANGSAPRSSSSSAQLFQAARGVVAAAAQAPRKRARPPAPAGDTPRRSSTCSAGSARRAAREQREHRGVGLAVARFGIGAVGEQPVDPRRRCQLGFEQQAAPVHRGDSSRARLSRPIDTAVAQAFAQQRQRRAVRRRGGLGCRRRRCDGSG